MDDYGFPRIDLNTLPSPCFVIDTGLLQQNLRTLAQVRERTGCNILLALKAFSMYSTFPLMKEYLQGTCASGANEARLGAEEFGAEVHVSGPAFSAADMKQILQHASTVNFNSLSQWHQYKEQALAANVQCGIRINPEFSSAPVPLYDPCATHSRLGVRANDFQGQPLEGITGLHVHALCQQNAEALQGLMQAVENKFGEYLPAMQWINFGGGHHITREDYNVDLLCELLNNFRDKYDLQLYMEPGEAVALNAGFLVATVLDIVDNEMKIAVLDTSAETHMPDVLAMPYRPEIIGAGLPGEKENEYRLAGPTCLAGDVIGDYSFDEALTVGSKIILADMAIYSMVKTTTFNGVNLPAIILHDAASGKLQVHRQFGYDDFKNRL